MKHFLAPFFILLIAILACSKTSPTNKTQNVKTDVPVAAPISLKAEQLTREYDENELAADGKYKDKSLEVSGRISDIAETFGSLTVQLEGQEKSGISLLNVLCSFDETEKSNIAKLKKGQTVTLIGNGDGKTSGLYVGLTDCRIK